MAETKDAAKSFSLTAGKPITCKAAVLWKPNEKFSVQNIVVSPPKENEVRIKILYTSICHSDVTVAKMEAMAPAFPIILGHESAGIVESVGEGVKGLKAGDHVLPFAQGRCFECSFCKGSKTSVCNRFPMKLVSPTLENSSESCYFTEDGKPIAIFVGVSTFSQYIVVHKANVAKIDPGAPLDRVGLLACGVTTGFGSAWNIAKVEKGSTVVVFGLGTIGLAVVEGCKLAGASRIIGVDINPQKAEIAKKFGVTEFLNPEDHPDVRISEVIKDMTGGGVEYSFECVGSSKIMAEAVESTDIYIGVAVIVGFSSVADTFDIQSQGIIWGRMIKGSNLGGVKVSDLPELVERAVRKDFDLEAYITHTLPLSKINEAMEIFASGQCLRINLDTEK